jgi:hypothetical protein
MWRNVINEIEMDPALCGRFQFGLNCPPVIPWFTRRSACEELAKEENPRFSARLRARGTWAASSGMQAATFDRAA